MALKAANKQILLGLFAALVSTASCQLPTFLRAGDIYSNIELTPETTLQARALLNLTGITRFAYMTQYVIVSVDTDEDLSLESKFFANPASDPKIFIRKLPFTLPAGLVNQTFANFTALAQMSFNTEQLSQMNFTSGPKILPLTKSMMNGGGLVEVMVTCRDPCKFTLKVTAVLINQLTSMDMTFNQTTRTFASNRRVYNISEPRSFNVYQVDIPPLIQTITLRNRTSYINVIDSLQFEIETDALPRTSIDLYYSYQGDDFYSSMDFTQNTNGLTTDQGKILCIPFDPSIDGYLYDSCLSRGCTFFFAIRPRNPLKVTVSARIFLKDQLQLRNQEVNNKALSPTSPTSPEQCWPFYIQKSLNDVSIMIQTYTGDETQWSVSQRDYDIGYNNLILQTDSATAHQIIIRSTDIWRNGEPPANRLIYLCATKVIRETSVSIFPVAKDWFQQLNLTEDTLTTFILDSKDYLSFIYSNDFLSVDQFSQNLTLSLAIETALKRQSVPRQLYTVCPYTNSQDCFLNSQQAISITSMQTVSGQSDDLSKTRLSVINHQPSACPFQTSCFYLMSVYNPDSLGPFKVSLRIGTSFQTQTNLNVFQQISSASVEFGRHSYYQIRFTPQQLATLSFNKIRVKAQSYSGALVLYGSTTQMNPSYTNGYEVMSITQQRLNVLEYDVSQIQDLYNFRLYLGVYGTEQAYFKLMIDADYTPIYPQVFKSPETALSANQLLLAQLDPSQLITELPASSYLNLTGNNQTASLYYRIPSDSIQTILFQQKIAQFNGNVTLLYNVTNIADNGTALGQILNQQIPLVLARNGPLGPFFNGSLLRFDFRVIVNGVQSRPTPWDLVNSFMRIQLAILSLQSEQRTFNRIEGDLQLNQPVVGYGFSETILYRRVLMDSLAQYQFNLTNLLGSFTYMLIKIGDPFKRFPIQMKDDYSYDYGKSNFNYQDTVTITLDQQMRNKTSRVCFNGSYPLAGGNDNCTMYVAIQCMEICAFNLSVNVIGNRSIFTNVSEPKLLTEGTQYVDSVAGRKMRYYFFPFNRQNKTPSDTYLVVNKMSNDVFVTARVLNNSHVPYINWVYPTALNTTYSFISQSGPSTNEVLVIKQTELLALCRINNTSCVLLIGVNSTATANSSSQFQISILDRRNMLVTNNRTIEGSISVAGGYDYYWLPVNTRNVTVRGVLSDRFKWQYILAVGTQTLAKQVNLFAELLTTSPPTRGLSDYESTLNGPDFINITSDDVQIVPRTNGRWAILMIGIQARQNDSRYSLISWGPREYWTSLNITDIPQDADSFKHTFDQRQIQNGTGALQPFKIFRYFNFGTRDLQILIGYTNAIRGSVYLLANNQPFRPEIAPADTFEGALQNEVLSLYQGNLPGYNSSMRNVSVSPFHNIPLYNSTSLISPVILQPNGSLFLMELSQGSSNGLWCQFCWIYFTIIPTQLQSNISRTWLRNITVEINISPKADGGGFIDTIKPNQRGVSQILSLSGTVMQRKFMLESFDPLILNISERANGFITVFITQYLAFLGDQAPLWQTQGTGPQVFMLNSTDSRFQLGVWYYITVVAGATQQTVSISLYQDKQIVALKNNTILVGRMKHRNDFVKYFTMPTLNQTFNYTAQITIRAKNPGFQPIVYAQRNDLINNTLAGELVYPSPARFTRKFERPFSQSLQQVSNFLIPC